MKLVVDGTEPVFVRVYQNHIYQECLDMPSFKNGDDFGPWGHVDDFTSVKKAASLQSTISGVAREVNSKADGWMFQTQVTANDNGTFTVWVRKARYDPDHIQRGKRHHVRIMRG